MGRTTLLAAALFLAGALLSSCYTDEAIKALFQWVIDNGGELSVEVRTNPEGIRGLYVTRDVKAGETFVKLPAACILNVAGPSSSYAENTISLLREMFAPVSRFRPYLDILPRPHELVNTCNFPEEYIPMFEDPYWEGYIRNWQKYMVGFWDGTYNRQVEYVLAEVVGTANVTKEDVLYACALAMSRQTAVSAPDRNRTNMVPIYDMGNHFDDCPTFFGYDNHFFTMEPGRDLKAGDEVCVSYSVQPMRPDHAIGVYGFLTPERDPPLLMLMDHHQFDLVKDTHSNQEVEMEPLRGDSDALLTEAERLQAIRTSLGDLPLSGTPAGGPAPTELTRERAEKYGWIGDLMREYQIRRRRALDYWIQYYLRAAAEGGNELPDEHEAQEEQEEGAGGAAGSDKSEL